MALKHTIFTPVYNRLSNIPFLYQKIKELDYPRSDFEWLIIDDGSTDGLGDYYRNVLSKDTELQIRYIHKENGGIHTAQNEAVRQAHGEYLTRIDSDDYLLPQALRIKDRYLAEYRSDDIAGVVGICLNASDGSFRSSRLHEDIIVSTGIALRKRGASGDRNFCIRRDVMLKFLLPEYNDTKWVPEGTHLWIPLDKEYKTIFVNDPMAVCAEANSGSMLGSLKSRSISGTMSQLYGLLGSLNKCRFTYSGAMLPKTVLKYTYSAILANKLDTGGGRLYYAYNLLKYKKDRFLFLLFLPPAWILSIIRK